VIVSIYRDMSILVICSWNRVPGPRSKIPYPVPNLGNYYPVFHLIIQNTTTFGLYLHLFTTLNSIVALMYFRLHIHKLHCSITRSALVSETTNIIRCDALTPQAVVFVTYFCYLSQMEFETGSGYPGGYLGNCNRVPGS